MLTSVRLTLLVACTNAAPTVHLEGLGDLVGTSVSTDARQFLGVPYATQIRWQNPIDWETPFEGGSRNAVKYGATCAQPAGPPLGSNQPPAGPQSEDCLFLNVFAPPAASSSPASFPVLVFLHGGGMEHGSGNTENGTALSKHNDVVVVTLNYRLGAFGLLPMHDAAEANNSTGLFAYLDQRSALRWVHKHIGAFGGDATRVMLFGQSAGATSVCVHLAMAGSAGLFHAAALESPYDCTRGDSLESALAQTDDMAAELGCNKSSSSSDKRACMTARTTTAVLKASTGPLMPNNGGTSLPHPTVDGVELKESPMRALAAGRWVTTAGGVPVPILVGSNTNEGTFFLHGPASKAALAAQLKGLTMGNATLLAQAQQLYPATGGTYRRAMAASMGHAKVNCAARRLASAAAATPKAKAWLYHFACFDACSGDSPWTDGVTHTMELPYVFGESDCKGGEWTNAHDAALSKVMMAGWTAMATAFDPSTAVPEWPEAGTGGTTSLLFNVSTAAKLQTETGYLAEYCDFWDMVAVLE